VGLGRVVWAVPPVPAVVTAIGCAGVGSSLGDKSMTPSLSPGLAAAGQALPPEPGASG